MSRLPLLYQEGNCEPHIHSHLHRPNLPKPGGEIPAKSRGAPAIHHDRMTGFEFVVCCFPPDRSAFPKLSLGFLARIGVLQSVHGGSQVLLVEFRKLQTGLLPKIPNALTHFAVIESE